MLQVTCYLRKKKSPAALPSRTKAQPLASSSSNTYHQSVEPVFASSFSSLLHILLLLYLCLCLSLHPGIHHCSSLSLPPSAKLAVFLSSSRASFPARPPPQEDNLPGHSSPWCTSDRSPPPAVPAAPSANPIPGSLFPHLSDTQPGLVPSSAHLQPIRTGLVLPRSDPQPRDYLQSITAQHVSRPSRRARCRRV